MPVNAAVAWGLLDYDFRQEFEIDGTVDGVQTDYQMMVTVEKGAGASSGSTVFLKNHAENFPQDIRFTKADGSALLDYWVESSDANTAIVWVEFDSIAGDPASTTFFIYYGFAGSADASDGDDTFVFFDDFPGSSLDGGKWDGDTGMATVAGGILNLAQDNDSTGTIASIAQFGVDTAFRSRLSVVDSGSDARTSQHLFGFADFAGDHRGSSFIVNNGASNQFVSRDGTTQV